MSDSDQPVGGDGSRQLSRRKILWGLAATGATASAGGGTAALFTDTEQFGSQMTAGTLDLQTGWGNVDTGGNNDAVGNNDTVGNGVPSIDLGRAEKGDTGRFHANVAVSGNPAYVWFRTACPDGQVAEEVLDVTVSLVTPDGTTTLASGPIEDVRQELGPGVRLDGVLSPDDTWQIVVEWGITWSVSRTGTVTFDFDFYAQQTRHVEDPPAVPPNWTGCDDNGGGKDISWIAFCTGQQGPIDLAPGDDFEIDGPTLSLIDIPASVNTVLLKSGQHLDVFTEFDPTGTLTTGTAPIRYEQSGNGFLNSDGRSNSTPCPGECYYKYDGAEKRTCDQS